LKIKIISGQKVCALWENPDSQSFWASFKFLCCPIISGTFKRLKKRIYYAKQFGHPQKSRHLKTFAPVNFLFLPAILGGSYMKKRVCWQEQL